tara:strand:- start:1336 stop:1545 length:210 start_codon:yes stop_codon:yes gene_type:complete
MLEQGQDVSGCQLSHLGFVHSQSNQTASLLEATTSLGCACFAGASQISFLGFSTFTHDFYFLKGMKKFP